MSDVDRLVAAFAAEGNRVIFVDWTRNVLEAEMAQDTRWNGDRIMVSFVRPNEVEPVQVHLDPGSVDFNLFMWEAMGLNYGGAYDGAAELTDEERAALQARAEQLKAAWVALNPSHPYAARLVPPAPVEAPVEGVGGPPPEEKPAPRRRAARRKAAEKE